MFTQDFHLCIVAYYSQQAGGDTDDPRYFLR